MEPEGTSSCWQEPPPVPVPSQINLIHTLKPSFPYKAFWYYSVVYIQAFWMVSSIKIFPT
jgi:hypothetical protein